MAIHVHGSYEAALRKGVTTALDLHVLHFANIVLHDMWLLKALFTNDFTFKQNLSSMSLHAISVFDKV